MYDFFISPNFSMFDLQKENKTEYFYIFKFKFKEVKVFNVPFTFNFKD